MSIRTESFGGLLFLTICKRTEIIELFKEN